MHLLCILTWFAVAAVAHVYVGYPVLVALLARLHRRPVARREITPSVSLVIAAYQEEQVIREKLDNSLQLDYPRDRLEIVVVTDGSSDSTPQIVAKYAECGIQLLHQPERRGKSAAINRVVPHVHGEILLFSDANALYRPDALRKLVRNFADPSIGCVSGRKTVVQAGADVAASEGTYWRYESALKRHESLLGSTMGVVGEMLALRARLFEPIPSRIINDDAYLALRVLRAGYRVLYEPEALSWEVGAASVQEDAVRRRRIAAGRYQVLFSPRSLWPWRDAWALFQLASHKLLRLLLPFFMLAALAGSAALVALAPRPESITLLAAQLAFYALAAVGWAAESAGQRGGPSALAYYLTRSNLASLQSLAGYLGGTQSVLWTKARRGSTMTNPQAP
jgi:cellulose synthase/poly-beta-1,6-N-acetylglucosamine synthase-like glycosyltransferase